MGYNAGKNIGTSNSIAIGGYTISDGGMPNTGENIAIGYSALRGSNAGAASNIGLGNYSLTQNDTGSQNVGLGFSSLYSNTIGDNNIGIGFYAGYNSTGSDNIFIGTGANPDLTFYEDSNQIVIGKEALGIGNNSVVLGNSSVTKTRLQGNVGIGTNAPNEKLTVSGNISASNLFYSNGVFLNRGDASREGGQINFNRAKDNATSFAIDVYSDVIGSADSRLRFFSATELMTLLSSGNLGIGTNAPNEKLTVSGNISANGNFISSSNYYLTTNLSPISARTGYFGTSLTLLANKIYELEYHLYFKNNNASATTIVNYALSGNTTFSNVNANFMQDVGGAGAVSTGTTVGSVGPIVDLGNTETLSASVSAYGILKAIVAIGSSNTTISMALSCNNSLGITPLKGSYRKVTQFN